MNCRVCDGKKLSLAIDLKSQPWGNHFLKNEEIGKEPFYPLRVVYCNECTAAQLDFTVKKEIMFAEHTYLSGITTSLKSHFEKIAKNVDQFFSKKSSKAVLDIGSNDGTQLKCFQALGYEVLGVESAKSIAELANRENVPTLNTFFNLECAKAINKKFQVINAAGVFFHLEELHSVTDGIKLSLDHEGIFIVQFLYMKSIMDNVAFDQIYHEHLLYYTLTTLNILLEKHGLSIFDATLEPIHGGSMIAYATHSGNREPTSHLKKLLQEEKESGCNEIEAYLNLASNIEILKKRNLEYLQKQKSLGKTIYGMGAPVKGNTLLNTFGIGKRFLDCLVEKNSLRKGLFSPGMHLPIEMEDTLSEPPDVYYVLAWNFKNEILKRNQELIQKGVEFYFPIDPKTS